MSPPQARPAWVWPLRLPRSAARIAWTTAGLARRPFAGWGWIPAAAAAGTVPLLIAFPLASPAHQLVSAVLLFALFLSAVRADATVKGVAAIGVAYLSHCALGIGLAAGWPEAARPCLPGGLEYWNLQQHWITTGVDPGYDPHYWLGAHAQLFGAMVLFGYLSLGLIPFLRGFYEVDLMNYYVGQLIVGSRSGTTAVGLGWHMWSLMRGVCYAVLVFEVASWSLERMTGRTLSTPARRRIRWGIALGFFLLDCLLKYFMLEPVRGQLEANLAG